MAAQAVFNQVMTNVLGSQDAALRQHIIDQGVDDLESLGSLTDDEIQTITDNIRRGIRADAKYDRHDSESSIVLNTMSTTESPDRFIRALESSVQLNLSTATSQRRKGSVDAYQLAKLWDIGIETARATIQNTTQDYVRSFENNLGARRMKPYYYQMDLKPLRTTMYGDFLIAPCKSASGNTVAMIYAERTGWLTACPLRERRLVHTTVPRLHRDIGFPAKMITDGAKEFKEGEFAKAVRKSGTTLEHVEAWWQRLNYCEMRIGHTKQRNKSMMRKSNTPIRLWDDAVKYSTALMSLMAQPKRHANEGRVPETLLRGDTHDISAYVEFAWYQTVWTWHPKALSPDHKVLARWLGPSSDIGMALTYRLITEKASFVDRSTVQPVTEEELRKPEVIVVFY